MFYTRCGADDWSILLCQWCNLENKSIREFLILQSDFNFGKWIVILLWRDWSFLFHNIRIRKLDLKSWIKSDLVSNTESFEYYLVRLMESLKKEKNETGRSIIDSKGWVPQKGSTCDIEPRLADTTKNTACESLGEMDPLCSSQNVCRFSKADRLSASY